MSDQVPRTPPRQRRLDLDSTKEKAYDSWNTPTSTTKNYKPTGHKRQKSFDLKLLTPEPTPQKSPRLFKKSSRDVILEDIPVKSISGKRSTIGSGRSAPVNLLPSIKAVKLKEEGPDVEEEEDLTRQKSSPVPVNYSVPSTPKKNIITSSKIDEWYGKSGNGTFEDADEDFEDYLDQYNYSRLSNAKSSTMKNPFLNSSEEISKRPDPIKITNPFITKKKSSIDYSTHMELRNGITGEVTVQELSEESKNIKPKRLNFDDLASNKDRNISRPSSAMSSPSNSPFSSPMNRSKIIDQKEINKKYVLKNLNNFINVKPKNSLDFEIFKDGHKES